MTTLLLSVTRNDGKSLVLEAILSERDVYELYEEAGRAERKLAALKKLLADKEIPIPDLSMTISKEAVR